MARVFRNGLRHFLSNPVYLHGLGDLVREDYILYPIEFPAAVEAPPGICPRRRELIL